MHYEGQGLTRVPRSGLVGGWGASLKRLGAVTVSHKCH